ncbi:MAG: DUF4860 domain-containing protein [Clostridiales bacterium]|jgi:hypothetical protein|nr:DUF4860 domain-containing protein [Clostridiales bacterium]
MTQAPASPRDERGSGLVELLMVMTLMIFFGYTIYILIFTGSAALQRIDAQRAAQADARIALSYVNVRVRQSDGARQIAVLPNGINGKPSLLLRYRQVDGAYDTWIFWFDGKLMEVLADADESPDWLGGDTIATIQGFTPALNDGSLTNVIEYKYGEESREVRQIISLRT